MNLKFWKSINIRSHYYIQKSSHYIEGKINFSFIKNILGEFMFIKLALQGMLKEHFSVKEG